MSRPLPILKYVPGVLCGLLVAGWVLSCFHSAGVEIVFGEHRTHFSFLRGSLVIWKGYDLESGNPFEFFAEPLPRPASGFSFLGKAAYRSGVTLHIVRLPIPFLLTLLLPVAAGCLIRFRFPLWSYFAWTALIAAELAYYLR